MTTSTSRSDAARSFSGAALLVLLGVVGCAGQRAKPEAAPVVVNVAAALQGPVTDYAEFTGRTDAVQQVEIKARATGYLEKVLFKDGDFVKANQPLYEIDPRTYAAQVKNLKGTITRTEASLTRADSELARSRRLLAGSAMSREEYEKVVAQKDEAEATMVSNKASLEQAELNLSFCKVLAPIDGIISRTKITAGNLVTADQTSLTTVVSVDPIYAYFDVDERTVLQIQQMIREEISPAGVEKARAFLVAAKVDAATVKAAVDLVAGTLTVPAREKLRVLLTGQLSEEQVETFFGLLAKNPKFQSYRERKVPVFLATQIEKGFPHEGFIDFVDNRLNATTGTLRVRGNFPNPERDLAPNLFVRIKLPLGEPYQAVLVSDSAVVTAQDRKFLYVVNAEGKVESRPVRLGPVRNGLRVVEKGVDAGELVVVGRLQQVVPGMAVQTQKVPMPSDAPGDRGPAVPPAVKDGK